MGRTVPSFRLALAEEESEWKVYRQHLDKPVRKDFDDLFAIPRMYLSACSGAVKLVRFNPAVLSMILQHYIELKEMTKRRQAEVIMPLCR